MGTRLVLSIISGPFEDTNKLTISQARIAGGQSLTVGRNRLSSNLGVRLDAMMSSKHFEVFVDDDVCRLRDLDSRNGTYVNGKRVREAILKSDDEIRAGQTSFRIHIQGGTDVTSTVIEFGAVTHVDLEDELGEEADEPTAAIELDTEGVFARLKSKMKGRG